ncbi:MAG: hypothetical protein IKR48_05310 [Kiritimatiellae bacterium]|nr:hypothetical protein [Kiritimatiellia bacterium]
MKFFWPVYLSVAVVGSAAIFFLAPKLGWQRESVAEQGPERITVSANLPTDVTRRTASGSDALPHVTGQDPISLGIFLARPNQNPEWGITARETIRYSARGKNLGPIPAATIFRFHKKIKSEDGNQLVSCSIIPGNPSETSLVALASTRLFVGDPNRLSAKHRETMLAYYRLAGQIARRKEDLAREAAAKNPFFVAWSQARKNLRQHQAESRQLTAQRERASGDASMKLTEKLQKRRYDQAALEQKERAAYAQYADWKKKHPEATPDAEKDPKVEALRKQMTALEPTITGLW